MAELSARTLVMAVQGVDAEICRIKDQVDGDVTDLEPDDQEMLLAYSQAATELKAAYLARRDAEPGLLPYEQLVAAD
ncbi:MAG TPA: hypothetical protein VGV37_22335 [Aliidongia sp.]|uniref:hypothetical protein n=1 Tax=Aliidongia sp. TaxID=1914230 RepID=UPI002DDD38C3|nr:hypothetical protein [Aliidongia sp.]HEV2677283.1 hypothetical protein [Aliidongia sp.]